MAFAAEKLSPICTLCCQEATVWVVGPCDHTLCLTCSARMRILCKKNECPVCRVEHAKVAVVKTPMPFSTIPMTKGIREDRKHGFIFTHPSLRSMLEFITAFSCSQCAEVGEHVVFGHLRQLKEHVRKAHNLYFCEICLENLKLFPSEHKLYTRQQLDVHDRDGDPDDLSYKGHPLCHFCEKRFLDKDTLFFHLKDNHFWCHICEADGKQDYYANYPELHRHFKKAHYMCEEGKCRYEKLSTVFRTKLDFQAHKAKVHTGGLTKAETRQLRQVDIQFHYSREESGDGMPSVSRRVAAGGRHYRTAQRREQEELELATALSLQCNVGSKVQEGKENQKKPQPVTIAENTKPTILPHKDTVPAPTVSTRQLRPPPGLGPPLPELSVAVLAADAGNAWPDLTQSVGLTVNGNPPSSVPPPPGFIAPKPPPGLTKNPPQKTNLSTSRKPPSDSTIIDRARELLNEQKFAEFKRLSVSYAKVEIPVKIYYRRCASLFGDAWADIVPELAKTMPDNSRRNELIAFSHRMQEPQAPAYSRIATGGGSGRFKPNKGSSSWQTHSSKDTVQLSEEEYPSLSTSARQPNPTITPSGWNVKVSVK